MNMKKNFINGLFMLAAGVFAVSCADYNETANFTAEPDPTFTEPYKDYAPVKSYIDRSKNPNMSLGVTLRVSEYNKQALAHAAAMTNFDNLAFGSSLMFGSIVNSKGAMNFIDMKNLLDHVEEIGGDVFGSPIAANANQADDWLKTLTAPIEIEVETIEDKFVDYTTMETFEGTSLKGKPVIVKNYEDNNNALKLPKKCKVYIVEGFETDTLGTYTITFYAKVDKDETIMCTFSGNKIQENEKDKKFPLKAGKWVKTVIDAMPAPGETKGYLMVEGNLNSEVYIKNVMVSHTPDNHRPQTPEAKRDTLYYALNTWCDGLMDTNAGRIKSFDLIDEALDSKKKLENGMLDLKHATDKIFWQDFFGSENYAKAVSDAAKSAYQNHGGDPAELKFFISETGLENEDVFESLKYWIDVWEKNGAQIDGINAKLNLTYSEDEAAQAENKASFDTLLDNLISTGKLVRLSNFDIRYQDATGVNVTAKDITEEQRQKLADYYAYIIRSYMDKIPDGQQGGLCKGNMVDTSDPVGLWSIDSTSRDWVRTATYKAFCDALSGK